MTVLNLLRRTPWQTWLIPVGTALLTVGSDRLRADVDELRERYDDLTTAVELRRAQVLGAADLDDEPELPHEQAHLEFSRRSSIRRPAVLVGLGLAGVVAGYLVRRAWSAALDQLDGEVPEPYPWEGHAARAGVEPLGHEGSDRWTGGDRKDEDVPPPSPETVCGDDPCEHAPGGVNHPAEGGASIGVVAADELDAAGLGIVEAAKIERMGTAAERLNRVRPTA